MGSVAAGLGSIGGALAQAQELKRKEALERLKGQIEQGNLSVSQRYAATNQQRLAMEQQEFAERQRLAKLPKFVGFRTVGGRLYYGLQNPDGTVQTKEVTGVTTAEDAQALEQAVQALPAEAQPAARAALVPYLVNEDFQGAKGALKPIMQKYAESQLPGTETISDTTQTVTIQTPQGPMVVQVPKRTITQKVPKGAAAPQGKTPAATGTSTATPSLPRGSRVLGRKALGPTEQRLLDSINTIEPTLDTLEEVIKSSKLENDNTPIAPRIAWAKYKYLKIAPEGARGEIIRNSAALQVMGAAPWIQIGRGKYLFETISNHLPNPEDSPKLLMDKVKFLRKVMADSKKAILMGVEDNTDPLGVLSGR